MPKATKGILVECDPSIKAIILKIQSESGNDLIVDDLDEQTLVVHPNKLPRLKELLEKKLESTQQVPEMWDSEG
ncbi:MAG: hypothetical protein M1824_004309 [Vezdaea acicularis]|nr:MAG: hypothetical protein M1824_004309 [Vezdaea acicularis]